MAFSARPEQSHYYVLAKLVAEEQLTLRAVVYEDAVDQIG